MLQIETNPADVRVEGEREMRDRTSGKVMDVFGQADGKALTVGQLASRAGLDNSQAASAAARLAKTGRLVRLGRGVYRAVSDADRPPANTEPCLCGKFRIGRGRPEVVGLLVVSDSGWPWIHGMDGCGPSLGVGLPESTPTAPAPVSDLESWWLDSARAEVAATIPKIEEYGSNDLVEIGRDLASVAGWTGLDRAGLAQLGILFYLRGKVARWVEAVAHHREVSDDTIFDIGVYARMAQRVRAAGRLG